MLTDKPSDGTDGPATEQVDMVSWCSAGTEGVSSIGDMEAVESEGSEIYKEGMAGRACDEDDDEDKDEDEDEGDTWDNGGS